MFLIFKWKKWNCRICRILWQKSFNCMKRRTHVTVQWLLEGLFQENQFPGVCFKASWDIFAKRENQDSNKSKYICEFLWICWTEISSGQFIFVFIEVRRSWNFRWFTHFTNVDDLSDFDLRNFLWIQRLCLWVNSMESSISAPTNGPTESCRVSWGRRVQVFGFSQCLF